MNPFSCFLIGNESLTRECGEMLLARGHHIAALVSHNPDLHAWGRARGLAVIEQQAGWPEALPGGVDWLPTVQPCLYR